MERDISYGGVDIDTEERRNIQACAGWARNADAKFWTYNTNTKVCTLRSSNTDSITAQHHISGSSTCHDLVDYTETESRQNRIGSYVSHTSHTSRI